MTLRGMWIIAGLSAAAIWGTQIWLTATNSPKATPESWLWSSAGVMVIALVATVGHVSASRAEQRTRPYEEPSEAERFQVSDEGNSDHDPGPYWHR